METEILKLALLAYEEDGYANFSAIDLTRCGLGEKKVREITRKLESDLIIINNTVQGYYSRFKLNYSGECPDYIYSQELTVKQKEFILRVSKIWNGETSISSKDLEELLPEYTSRSISSYLLRIKSNTNKSVFDIIKNSIPIKYNLLDREGTTKDSNGIKYVATSYVQKTYKCQFCGETDSSKFLNSKCTCINCSSRKKKSSYSIGRYKDPFKYLFQKARTSFTERPNIIEFNLTLESIKKQWSIQNGCDYYTGLDFVDMSKVSIDRLDSSKGYTIDNIVLTDYRINVMKNNLSVSEFKNLIELIHSNISNF